MVVPTVSGGERCTPVVRGHGQLGVAGHFGALVPGQGAAHQGWQVIGSVDADVGESSSFLAFGQAQRDQEPAVRLDQGRDSALADHGITFPRARNTAI